MYTGGIVGNHFMSLKNKSVEQCKNALHTGTNGVGLEKKNVKCKCDVFTNIVDSMYIAVHMNNNIQQVYTMVACASSV
jgi:hypothetical protein